MFFGPLSILGKHKETKKSNKTTLPSKKTSFTTQQKVVQSKEKQKELLQKDNTDLLQNIAENDENKLFNQWSLDAKNEDDDEFDAETEDDNDANILTPEQQQKFNNLENHRVPSISIKEADESDELPTNLINTVNIEGEPIEDVVNKKTIEVLSQEPLIPPTPPTPSVPRHKQKFSTILELALTRPAVIANDLTCRRGNDDETVRPDTRITDKELLELIKRDPDMRYLDLSDCLLISDLSVIAKLTDLKELSLCGCFQLEDTSFLSHLQKLKVLNLGNTSIVDLTPLSALTELEVLNIKYTDINDLTPISNLVNLHDLVLWGCVNIKDITAVQNFKELRLLDLDSTGIYSIDPIRNLIKLNSLFLDHCRVSDLAPIAGLINIQAFSMVVRMLIGEKNLNHFRDLHKLKMLALKSRGINNLEVFRNMKQLTCFEFQGNCLADLSPLEDMTEIRRLYIDGNKGIKDISCLEKMTKLVKLNIPGNRNTKMKLGDISVVKNFRKLDTLDLQHNIVLKDISAIEGIMPIEELYLNDCPQIEDIHAIGTLVNMTTLILTGCARITDLSPLKNLHNAQHLKFNGTNSGPHYPSDFKMAGPTFALECNNSSDLGKHAISSFQTRRKTNKVRKVTELDDEI